MSRRIIATIFITILISLFVLLYTSPSLPSKNKSSDLAFFLTFQTQDSPSTLTLSGTYILSGQENIFESIISQQKDISDLRSGVITISYMRTTNTITSLIIQEIHQSQGLGSAYRTFIDQLIVPRLHTNLINSPTSLTLNNKVTPGLISTHYFREYHRKDTQQTAQILQISLKKSCGIQHFLGYKDSCSLKGNYILSTPLSSGPVSGTISGSIIPVLQ